MRAARVGGACLAASPFASRFAIAPSIVNYALLTTPLPPSDPRPCPLVEDLAEAGPPWSASTALLAAALTLLGWLLVGCANVAPPPGPELPTLALPQPQPKPQPQPLFQRLGGVEAIQRLSTRVLDRTAGDARTGASFTGVNRRVLDRSVADYLCRVADGPCVYEGETMRNSHADLGITGSQFDLMVQFLREELDAAGVPQQAKNELLRRVAPTRRDIVQR